MKALELAVMSAETMMKKYAAKDLPPVGHFHYHQGVFLSGMQHLWMMTGDIRYFDYAREWVDSTLGEDGFPFDQDKNALDDMQPGVLLYPIMDEVGEGNYKKILDRIISYIDNWPTTSEGGFYHKVGGRAENMWLDGMYMGGPVTLEYAIRYSRPDLIPVVMRQMRLMRDRMTDEKTGLMYHTYDPRRKMDWADPESGCSSHFWGRAIGWYAATMFILADLLPEDNAYRRELIGKGTELVRALLEFRDEKTGLWYQVVDRGDDPENWHEISCSCLYLYALCSAVRLGALDKEKMRPVAEASLRGIEGSLNFGEDGYLGVRGVCIGTGVGNYAHYLARPTSENDLHGVGAFLLMACEYAKVFENEN